MTTLGSEHITIRVPCALLARLRKQARRDGVPLSVALLRPHGIVPARRGPPAKPKKKNPNSGKGKA